VSRAASRLRLLGAVLLLADLLCICGSMRLAYLLRFRFELGALETVPEAPYAEYLKPLAVFLVLVPVLFRVFDLYRLDELHSTVEQATAAAKAVTLATLVVLAFAFYYRDFSYSRLTFAYNWAILVACATAARYLVRRHLLRRYERGLDRRRALIVGEPGAFLVERLRDEPAFGLELLGVLRPAREEGPPDEAADGTEAPPGKPEPAGAAAAVSVLRRATAVPAARCAAIEVLGTLDDLEATLERHGVEEVLIVEAALAHDDLLRAIDACERRGVDIRLVPPIYDLLVAPSDFTYIQGVPLIAVNEQRYRRASFALKRVFDVVVSLGVLVLLAPLLGLVALLVRLGSRGPVLFVQVRAGENGRPFRMYKFRTMVEDAERRLAEVVDVDKLAEPVFKVARDPRVTPAGRWLRRLSIDELPQLVNVLKGDMSLVGPRPEELALVGRYDVWQRRRLKVKPGITGLQQVERRAAPSLAERVRYDIAYIRRRSFLLDLVILLRTFGAVLRGRGAT